MLTKEQYESALESLRTVALAAQKHRDDRGWSFSMYGDDSDPQTWSDLIEALDALPAWVLEE